MIAAHVCMFKRSKKQKAEYGIAIVSEPGLSDVQVLVDINGKSVPRAKVFDYILYPHLGTILVRTPFFSRETK